MIIAGCGLSVCMSGCFKVEKVPPPKPPYRFVTPNHLFAVAASGLHVWIVGFDGTIVYSPDSGATWEHQQSGMQVNLCDVSFVSPTHGWSSGRAGTMLHTSDGGKTWVPQTTGTSNHLFAVHFVDQQYGWAVGDFGTIIATTDAGATWSPQGAGEDKIYNDVYFIDRTTGWIAGEYGTIYATTDGGSTWHRQECPDIIPVVSESEWEQQPPSLYSIYFNDSRSGFACGMDGTIIATTDGGKSWRKSPNPAEALKVTLYKIQGSADVLIAVGQKGTCVVSRDRGLHWELHREATQTRSWLRDMALSENREAWAVGARGTILKTTDGATTWKVVSGIMLASAAR